MEDAIKQLQDAVAAVEAAVPAPVEEDPLFTAVKEAFVNAGWSAPVVQIPVTEDEIPAEA